MNIEEFLKARVNGLMYYRDLYVPNGALWDDIGKLVSSVLDMIEFHKDWPVMVTTEPTYELDKSDPSSLTYKIVQQMTWTTNQEYIARFGTEPPTAPILLQMAQRWSTHPDFKKEWLI